MKITIYKEICYLITREKLIKLSLKKLLNPYLDMFNGEVLSYRLSKKPNAKALLDVK